jgi:hypothetical protein
MSKTVRQFWRHFKYLLISDPEQIKWDILFLRWFIPIVKYLHLTRIIKIPILIILWFIPVVQYEIILEPRMLDPIPC